MTACVKALGENIGTFQIVFFRGLFTFIFTYVILKQKNIYIWGNNHEILISRGIIGTIALFLVYESILRFTLAEATLIQYLYPLFISILSVFFLSEKFSKSIVLSILFGLVGVYIVLNFPFINYQASFNFINLAIAISGSFLTGLAYILVKMASERNESPYVIMFYFPLFTVPLSFFLMQGTWQWPNSKEWILLLLVGFFSQFGQIFLTHGYKNLPASNAAITSFAQVPFAILIGVLVFKEGIYLNHSIGSIIIFISITLVITRKDRVV